MFVTEGKYATMGPHNCQICGDVMYQSNLFSDPAQHWCFVVEGPGLEAAVVAEDSVRTPRALRAVVMNAAEPFYQCLNIFLTFTSGGTNTRSRQAGSSMRACSALMSRPEHPQKGRREACVLQQVDPESKEELFERPLDPDL